MMAATGIQNGLTFQSSQFNGKWMLRRHSPAPSAYNVCACSVARVCPDASWSGGQFLCHYGDNCTKDTVVWKIPGFVKSCSTMETILNSDLRCFFNKTCFHLLLSMYNTDMPHRLSLPTRTLSIHILDRASLVSFSPESTIDQILTELMIDSWPISINYTNYYKMCSPTKCTFMLTERLDLFYVFTIITSVFGGLVIILRLLVPLLVTFIHWMWTYRSERNANTRHPLFLTRRDATVVSWRSFEPYFDLHGRSNVSGLSFSVYLSGSSRRSSSVKMNIFRVVTTMNFFKQESSISSMVHAEKVAIKATRIYAVLFISSIVAVALFNSADQITVSTTVPSPSLITYESLKALYPNTLSCACRQTAVSHSVFATVKPIFHPVIF